MHGYRLNNLPLNILRKAVGGYFHHATINLVRCNRDCALKRFPSLRGCLTEKLVRIMNALKDFIGINIEVFYRTGSYSGRFNGKIIYYDRIGISVSDGELNRFFPYGSIISIDR